MKKLFAFYFITLVSQLIISCNYEIKKSDSGNSPKKDVKSESTSGDEGVVGKWKWVEWSHPDLTAEEKEKIMSQAEIEFTADGKFITRVPGKEPDIKNYFFDEKQNILLVTIEGKEDRNEVTFTGNKMILKGAEATVGFQRK